MDGTDPFLLTAVFGKQVENFLQSEVGDFLLKKAKAEESEALQALSTVSPWRRRRIRDLQNQVYRAQSFMKWLGEAVEDGRQAAQLLEDGT